MHESTEVRGKVEVFACSVRYPISPVMHTFSLPKMLMLMHACNVIFITELLQHFYL